MKQYTEEQKRIAKQYEDRMFAALSNDAEFDRLVAEFDALMKSWDDQNGKPAERIKQPSYWYVK